MNNTHNRPKPSKLYGVYTEDTSMTSVVSFPERCSLWGDNRFRGNCDGQLFKNLVLRYRAKSVADPIGGQSHF